MRQLKNKILVTRTDRLGDVLLSLPSLKIIREIMPDAELHFLFKEQYVDVLSGWLNKHYIKPLAIERLGGIPLSEGFRAERYRAALFLHYDHEIVRASRKAGITKRFGNFSRVSAYWNLTHGILQRRSLAQKNEAEYNLDLAKYLLKKITTQTITENPSLIELPPSSDGQEELKQAFTQITRTENAPYIVVHPGMGGSALNLSADAYAQAIEKLDRESPETDVIVSIGPAESDQDLAKSIRQAYPRAQLIQGLSLVGLMELFRGAETVVAPSTGPLHLAHYAGTQTLGLFPPVRTQRKERWSPWGATGPIETLSPDVPCPAKAHCLGDKCVNFNCLDQLTWKQGLKPARMSGS